MAFAFVTLAICLFVSFIVEIKASNDDFTLSWNVTATTTSSSKSKVILKNVIGHARPGRLHAVIGPSGTILYILQVCQNDIVQFLINGLWNILFEDIINKGL